MVLRRLRQLVSGRTECIHECRNCGTKLDEPVAECPTCGSTEIASYEL